MLPVLTIEKEIVARLTGSNRLILASPTGSGKTTQVPQILLRSGLIPPQQQIIVLQPRRLATRMVARRVAQELNVTLGGIVGYQTRHDNQTSAQTRIRFMTEGLLLRLFESDPKLTNIGAVVLDEFHERNLAADLSLGLVKRLQETHRPDLRMVVMSATLDTQKLVQYLLSPVLETGGRLFPVEEHYLPRRSMAAPWDLAADALAQVLDGNEDGDVLIFMPGSFEIRRTIEACRKKAGVRGSIVFYPLHGSLPPDQQDAALAPAARGQRKVVVATNVAETSITIEGIRHVIDSGLARINRYDSRRGLNVLKIEPISQASATQRAGRAGRTAPGTCWRLWSLADHRARPAHDTAEVHRVELAETVLHVKALGIPDLRAFPWLDPPLENSLTQAAALLKTLGAIDDQENLTALGRRMAQFPVHPRLSRMLLEAAKRGCLARAALWAALIGEREITSGRPPAEHADFHNEPVASDLILLERVFETAAQVQFNHADCAALKLHANACRDAEQTRRAFLALCRRAKLPLDGAGTTADLLKCLLTAFPDHVAMLRDAHQRRCVMGSQKRVVLDKESVVKKPGPILALDMREVGRGQEVQTALSLASELDPNWLGEVHPDRVTIRKRSDWNATSKAVEEVEEKVFDDLVFESISRPRAATAESGEILVEMIVRGELKLELWDEKVDQWIARTRCVSQWFPERQMIGYEPDDLRVILHEIVGPATQMSQLRQRECFPAIRDALSWDDQQFVEKMAPSELPLPSGKKMKIEYQPGNPPRGRGKIQDFYGLSDTPRIAGSRVKLVLEILGPNYRPLQVTEDLAGFWKNLYPTLRKELSRRYPRHEWR